MSRDHDDVPSCYPPDVRVLRLARGQRAALIWDAGGECVEYRLSEEDVRAGLYHGARLQAGATIISALIAREGLSPSPADRQAAVDAALGLLRKLEEGLR